MLWWMCCRESLFWDDYAKTMEKAHPGISKTKGFRYPPVFPIVYYEGTGKWTAAIQEERANTKRERERADQAEEAQKLVEQYW